MSTRKDKPRVAILVDRSRDAMVARDLVGLQPDDRYHTTDNQMPLRAATLARHDVLVIAGHGPATYSGRELDAIERFVRRGGGLLLAGSAGVFERYTGRPAEEMAVAAIARRFSVEFLPPRAAAGRPKPDHELVVGYPDRSIRIHGAAPVRDLKRYDVCLRQWSPVQTKRRHTTLLSHRRTGEAAALATRFGKGRVIAVGNADFLTACRLLRRRLLDHLAGRPTARGPLPYEILPPLRTRRRGALVVRYTDPVAGRVATVLRLARTVLPQLDALLPARHRPKKQGLCIELLPGCTARCAWWRGGEHTVQLGADASDAELAFAMARHVFEPLLWRSPIGWSVRETVLGGSAMLHAVGLMAMGWAGFDAGHLAEALERDSRRRYQGLDAGWHYAEGAESPGFWLWRALGRRFGDDILARLFKAIPKKLDWKHAPFETFTPLDVCIHFLSQAARTDLFPWFAERGATVHPLPQARFGSKPFKRGVLRALRRSLADTALPASGRLDAVHALVGRQKGEKRPLGYAARQLRSRDPARRLVGAARLARVRDPRGTDTLRALATADDDAALAAVAALFLVETGHRDAAGRLAALAEGLDPRFQLDAGHHLRWLGDARAERFGLDGLRRRLGRSVARMDVVYGEAIFVFPTVNGQHAANFFTEEGVGHMPGGTHVSRALVDWAHTGGKWRRKGLARAAMRRTFDDPRIRRCSCAWLGTGVRNTAHALYRSFGFVDVCRSEELQRDLKDLPPVARVKGIRVRAYRPGDEVAMARLCNTCYGEFLGAEPRRPERLWPGLTALVAHKGRKLVGFVQACADPGDARAWVEPLAVAPGKRREEIAAALMTRLHKLLEKQGLRRVALFRATDHLAPLLQPLGYVARKSGGVGMFKLINLPRFLEEIAPLLERRLEKRDWHCTLALRGETHRAGVTVRGRRVAVSRRLPARADITLEGSDRAITQVVAGIESPLEPGLQLDLRITPPLNRHPHELLEALFPRLEKY